MFFFPMTPSYMKKENDIAVAENASYIQSFEVQFLTIVYASKHNDFLQKLKETLFSMKFFFYDGNAVFY